MPSIVSHATTADGTDLLLRHWPATEPWASVLLVHGLGEHSGRYEHVGDQLAAAGLDDGLVPPAASEILGSLSNVERRTYPGLRHELHNEPEGPAILDEVIAWLRERATIPPQPNTASGERLAR